MIRFKLELHFKQLLLSEERSGNGADRTKGIMGNTAIDTNALLALVEALADAQITAAAGGSSARGYVKARPPSFSGKQKDSWSLFKMQLLAYLSTLGLEGVLEVTFDKELPPQQDTVLDAMDTVEAVQGDACKANAKVMQVLVLGFKKPALINTIAMSKSAEWPVGKAWRVWKTFHGRYGRTIPCFFLEGKNSLRLRLQHIM